MHMMMKMIETGEETFFCITLSALNEITEIVFITSPVIKTLFVVLAFYKKFIKRCILKLS